jgi:dephospho-CoA kinase
MLRVGLTGGIASGKSRVLRVLASGGCFVLDLDRVAHDVMAPGGAAYGRVLAAFGEGIRGPDGTIDRRRLGARVFADSALRRRLDALVHPVIRDEEAARLAAAEAGGAAVSVSDAALLVESGGHLRYDRLVVAWCPPDEQRRRLRARDGLDAAAVEARLAAQMPGDEKRRFAHLEIATEGRLEDTDARATALAETLRSLAARPPARARLRPEAEARLLATLPARGPGGIDVARLVEHLQEAPSLEMQALAALLDPPGDGPWYREALGRPAAPGPELLAVPLARHSLLRRGVDPEFLAAVAASVARLTHTEPVDIATAVLAALRAARALEADGDATIALDEARGLAERWGGAAPDVRRAVV